MAERKAFLLRIDPAILESLQKWADDELRSLNGQIEFVLRRVLQQEGRLKDKKEPRNLLVTSDSDELRATDVQVRVLDDNLLPGSRGTRRYYHRRLPLVSIGALFVTRRSSCRSSLFSPSSQSTRTVGYAIPSCSRYVVYFVGS